MVFLFFFLSRILAIGFPFFFFSSPKSIDDHKQPRSRSSKALFSPIIAPTLTVTLLKNRYPNPIPNPKTKPFHKIGELFRVLRTCFSTICLVPCRYRCCRWIVKVPLTFFHTCFNMMLMCCAPMSAAEVRCAVTSPFVQLHTSYTELNGQDSAPEWMDAFCIKWFWVVSQHHHFFFLNRLIREKLDDWSFSLPVINDNQIVRNTSDGVEGNSAWFNLFGVQYSKLLVPTCFNLPFLVTLDMYNG